MGLSELKQKIQIQIENADERLLHIVSTVFDNYWNEDTFDENTVADSTVAYDVNEKPLNLKAYNKQIEKGIADFNNEKFISHEQLLEEIKSWRNEI